MSEIQGHAPQVVGGFNPLTAPVRTPQAAPAQPSVATAQPTPAAPAAGPQALNTSGSLGTKANVIA